LTELDDKLSIADSIYRLLKLLDRWRLVSSPPYKVTPSCNSCIVPRCGRTAFLWRLLSFQYSFVYTHLEMFNIQLHLPTTHLHHFSISQSAKQSSSRVQSKNFTWALVYCPALPWP